MKIQKTIDDNQIKIIYITTIITSDKLFCNLISIIYFTYTALEMENVHFSFQWIKSYYFIVATTFWLFMTIEVKTIYWNPIKVFIVLRPQFPVYIGCVRLNFELEYDVERISNHRMNN